jgi:hypothetical protein
MAKTFSPKEKPKKPYKVTPFGRVVQEVSIHLLLTQIKNQKG